MVFISKKWIGLSFCMLPILLFGQFYHAQSNTEYNCFGVSPMGIHSIVYSSGAFPKSFITRTSYNNATVLWQYQLPDSITGVINQVHGKWIYTLCNVGSSPYGYLLLNKMDSSGNLAWSKKISLSNSFVNSVAFLVTKPHQLYIGGTNCGITNFICSLDSNGNQLWTNSYLHSYAANGGIDAITEDIWGRILAVSFTGGASNNAFYLFTVTANGSLFWKSDFMRVPYTVSGHSGIDKVEMDLDSNIYFNCNINDSSGTKNAIYKFDNSGNILWANYFPHAPNKNVYIDNFDIDTSGYVYTVGNYYDQQNNVGRSLLTKIDGATGNPLLVTRGDSTFSGQFSFVRMKYIDKNEILLGGTHFGKMVIAAVNDSLNGLCKNPYSGISAVSMPAFIPASYSLATVPQSLNVANAGIVLTAASPSRIGYCGSAIDVAANIKKAEDLEVFPNPACDNLTVRMPGSKETQLKIYSADGVLLLTKEFSEEDIFDISSFAQGIYVVRIGSQVAKLVKQ